MELIKTLNFSQFEKLCIAEMNIIIGAKRWKEIYI